MESKTTRLQMESKSKATSESRFLISVSSLLLLLPPFFSLLNYYDSHNYFSPRKGKKDYQHLSCHYFSTTEGEKESIIFTDLSAAMFHLL